MVPLRNVHTSIGVPVFDFGVRLSFDAVCCVLRGSSIPGTDRLSFIVTVLLPRRWMSLVMLCKTQVLFSKFKFTCTAIHTLVCHETRRSEPSSPQQVPFSLEISLLKLLR